MKTPNKGDLQSHQGKELTAVKPLELPSLINSLKNLGWTDEEATTFNLQNTSYPWGKMSENHRSIQIKALLLRITVITGWSIPDEQGITNILFDQLNKKLTEDYSSLNVEEIEYAFRSIGTSVEDWGKSINLNLIDKVLIPYIHMRAAVREMASHALMQTPLKAVDDFSWGENCEVNYQKYLSGRLNISLLPWQCYNELVKVGMMAADVYEEYIKPASLKLLADQKANRQMAILAGRQSLAEEITKTIEELNSTCEISPRTIQHAKRLAVVKLFLVAQANGYKHLFEKV